MKSILLITLLLISAFSRASDNTANKIDISKLPNYSTQYSPKRDAFADGRDAIKLAQQTNRRVLIEVGGEWCSWCHTLDTFLDKNPDIKQQLHNTFVMLKINVSEENDNSAFLSAFPKPLGYPHMYVADQNGSVLWSKDTADFIQQGKYARENFLEFIQRWKISTEIDSDLKVSQK